jgi:outer membrane protein OmpA-like peptidoglycan-associated protein
MSRKSAFSGRFRFRFGLGVSVALVSGALGGCSADKVLDAMNPVGWYRDITGSSKNDTKPDAPNAANLESGSKEPYPDLSSVPNEPTRGLTEEEKAKLAQGLIADRDNAHYTDEQIRGGNAGAIVPAQTPVPEEQLPYAGGPNATPGPAPGQGANTPKPKTPPAAPPQAAAAPPPPTEPVAATREAAAAQPPIRGTPQPQTPNGAPPRPTLPPVPPPTPPAPFPGAPAGHPEPPPAPEQVAGVPTPPNTPVRASPAAPVTPAVAGTPGATPVATAGPIGKRTKSAEIGEIAFAAGSKALPSTAGETLAKVPGLHAQYGGIIRVVAYAPAADSGNDPAGAQLAAYQAALDRANVVKGALVSAGVPAGDIVAEAARSRAPVPERVDLYVEY